jgi:hypothetical protein
VLDSVLDWVPVPEPDADELPVDVAVAVAVAVAEADAVPVAVPESKERLCEEDHVSLGEPFVRLSLIVSVAR